MKKHQNEQGYALLLVLLLVVLIMIISTVFMRGAISNMKQEKVVDQSNLAVVVAERDGNGLLSSKNLECGKDCF